ncbi:MAG: molecular chaperone TorD family protein [Coriobacteriaceae bacterium]|jgi:TorA maturation chaperone TorD|nr:molecular chaperone TorD family protein [Coriobacteriaceae bacterium]
MTMNDNIGMLLAARAGAYRIFQNLLGNEPSADMLEQLACPDSREVLGLLAVEGEEYRLVLDRLISETEHILAGSDDPIPRLKDAFTRLFVGPGKVEANPWESMYTTSDTVLFQKVTLEVRKAYVASGFIPQAYPHVADDHIALELDFMARLAERLSAAYESGDAGSASSAFKASRDFLCTHLLAFVEGFAAAVDGAKHGYWYRWAALALAAFLEVDAQALEELQAHLMKEEQCACSPVC